MSTDAIQWIWCGPLVVLYTVVMAMVSLFTSLVDGTGRRQHACARFWAQLILKTCRAHVEVQGLEHVPLDRPCLITCNHQSYFDIWALLASLPVQFRFAAKDSLFRIPFLGWHLKRSGNIPVHRQDPKKAIRSLREAGRRIDDGIPVVLFPEGNRSPSGEIMPFKKGTFLLAIFCSAPILPITIIGSRHLLPKHSFRFRPGRMTLIIHPPVETEGLTSADLETFSSKIRDKIVSSYTITPS